MTGIVPGPNSPLLDLDPPKRKVGRPEDDLMRYTVGPIYGGLGFKVYVNSTRRKPKGVTPGIADLIVCATALGLQFYHEVKRPGDRQSLAQSQFQSDVEACGMTYVLGDDSAAEEFLVWLGVAYFDRPDHGLRAGGADPRGVFRTRLRSHWPEVGTPAAVSALWRSSPLYEAQKERWGWKATPGAIRRATRLLRPGKRHRGKRR